MDYLRARIQLMNFIQEENFSYAFRLQIKIHRENLAWVNKIPFLGGNKLNFLGLIAFLDKVNLILSRKLFS